MRQFASIARAVDAQRTRQPVVRVPTRTQAKHLETKTWPSPNRPSQVPIARRCACGGIVGPSGECSACRARRLAQKERLAYESPLTESNGLAAKAYASSTAPRRWPAQPPSRIESSSQVPSQPFERAGAPPDKSIPIGPPNDAFEREARVIAERVLAGKQIALPPSISAPAVQRVCLPGGALKRDEWGGLRREPIGPPRHKVAPPIVEKVLASPGQSIALPIRWPMEASFGYDLGDVRLHTDSASAKSAAEVGSAAYTVGSHIVFGSGRYSPTSTAGRRLLAHELAHVIQQRAAVVRGPVVQRQDIEDLPEGPRQRGSENVRSGANLVRTIDRPEPLSCPPHPTNLGELVPVPPCDESDEDVDGRTFEFCADSDIFKNPADRNRIRDFAGSQDSPTEFVVHAYASKEGPGTSERRRIYNRNLACHRAKRAARELINAGVREERIHLFSNGPTERFGAGEREADLARNRVVVVAPSPRARQQVSVPTNAPARQVADEAKARITRGEYELAADAYVARWTCGRFRTLADAVARTTVLIEGEPGAFPTVDQMGTIAPRGLNTIVLSRDITLMDDPVACAASRIADLTFHHVSRPQLPSFAEQHAGALHLLFLGGFTACEAALLGPPFSVPEVDDPKQGLQPSCADQPLPGAITPQRQPSRTPVPATFRVNFLDVAQASGNATPTGSQLFIGTESPPGAITAIAAVTAVGDPREIAAHRVGFVQTALEEDNVATYVDGQRIRWRLPLPLRDGPQRGTLNDDPPWFDINSRVDASPGTFQVQLTDFPDIRMFRWFVDLSRVSFFASRPPTGARQDFPTFDFRGAIDDRNVVDRGRRRIRFATWLVARRNHPLAPVDHSSTQFLAGRFIDFTIVADATGHQQLGPGLHTQRATGGWRVTSTVATPTDASRVQLRGATPADFFAPSGVPLFNEFLVTEGAPSRGVDPRGKSFREFRQEVERIADAPRRARGLTRRLTVQVMVDLTSGRVILDTPDLAQGAVRVDATAGDPPLAPASAAQLARDIFPDVRKLVLGDDPSIRAGTLRNLRLPITLGPLQP